MLTCLKQIHGIKGLCTLKVLFANVDYSTRVMVIHILIRRKKIALK